LAGAVPSFCGVVLSWGVVEAPGVKIVVEGCVESFAAFVGCVSWFGVTGGWGVTASVWEPIVGPVVDVVGFGSWFNALD